MLNKALFFVFYIHSSGLSIIFGEISAKNYSKENKVIFFYLVGISCGREGGRYGMIKANWIEWRVKHEKNHCDTFDSSHGPCSGFRV